MSDKMDEYLWDKSGPPDPDVVRLEELLRPLGQQAAGPVAAIRPEPESTARLKPESTVRLKPDTYAVAFSRRGMPALAAAALLAISVGGWWLVNRSRPATASWTVTSVEGSPTISSRRIGVQTALPVGDWLETDVRSKASVSVAGVGRVEIDPGTRVSLLSARDGDHRFQLTRGTLHAVIWAPPGQFSVETPSSLAVDLGCAYTLTVDEAGNGLVHVTAGWVGFEWQGRESFIPAGSVCATRRGIGPGTPHHQRSSPAVRAALDTIDFAPADPTSSEALAIVLSEAGERDEVTLWHLLTRVPVTERDRVFDRLARFVPPPAGVTRDGIRAGRRDMLDQWWDALGLGTVSWWRTWKQPWQGSPNEK